MHLTKEDIFKIDRIKRLNLINSVSGIKSANLIGTQSSDGYSNLAVFSSVVHLGSNPAYLGFVLRPDSNVRRHSYENIESSGYYTINCIHNDFIENAHYTSAKFKAKESEFEKCNIEKEFLDDFFAPYVKASKLKMGMKLQEVLDIKVNSCKLLIGSIEHLYLDSSVMEDNGQLNLEKLALVGIGGLNRYYGLNEIGQFPYARVTELPNFKKVD